MKRLMNLSWLLLAGMLLLNRPASAQEVIYSVPTKYDIHNGDFSVIGKVNDKIYTYRSGPDGFFLDAFNDSMDRLATVVLDFFPTKIYETKFIAYANKIIVIYQSVERGKVIIHAAKMDDAGRLMGNPVNLDSARTGFFGANKNYFSTAISDNKQYIIVYAPDEKGNDLKLTGTLLDEDLKPIKRFYTGFKTDNEIGHGDGLLGNDGTFYLPVYTPVGGHNFNDGAWLLSMTKEAGKVTSTELPLNNMYLGGSYQKLDNRNNRVYFGGYYSSKKNGNYEGVEYAYFDAGTQSFPIKKQIPFDERLRNATGERNKKRAFNDFVVRQLIVKNDGGFVLIGEDYTVTTQSAYVPGFGYYSAYYNPFMNARTIREFRYNDIMALSYNAEGVMDWPAFIRKDQYSQEDNGLFSSYSLLNTGGSLGFLFNDYNRNHSTIQLATIDDAGKVDIHALAAGGKDDPDWVPKSGKQISGSELIVPCLMKREISFAKIVF